MKNQILLLAISSTLLYSTAGNSKTIPTSTVFTKIQSDEIDLRGRIEPGEIRREIKPISAYLEENAIKAQFHFDIGTVQVTIVDAIGTSVYNTSFSSSIAEIQIPTTNLVSGNYTITFATAYGQMTGDFTL